MNKFMLSRKVLLLVSGAAVLVGCGVVDERRDAYKNAELMQPLEVPPDLLSIEATDDLSAAVAPMGKSMTLSEFERVQSEVQQDQSAPAPAKEVVSTSEPIGLQLNDTDVTVERDGTKYWLVVPGEPSQWWNKVKRFWQSQEIGIEREAPALGLLYTEWYEDKSKLSEGSFVEKAFSFLRSTNMKDQYIVRFEATETGDGTELHVVHRGIAHHQVGEDLRWLPRERDVELEIEVIKRLALYIGLGEEKAAQLIEQTEVVVEKAVIIDDGEGMPSLKLAMSFDQAWEEVGDHLLASRKDVEDFNRSTGTYYVRGNLMLQLTRADVFASFESSEGQEKPFLVKLREENTSVSVVVEEREGVEIRREEVERFLEALKREFD